MPIYEFVCEACGRLTEVMQKVSDPPPPACPECGENRLAKLVSRTSFQLKGGGWYADLYSSAKKKPQSAAAGAGSSGSSGSSGSAGSAGSTGSTAGTGSGSGSGSTSASASSSSTTGGAKGATGGA